MFIESFAPFFNEFAVPCFVNGVPRRGIFDEPYKFGAIASSGISSTGPTLTLPTADVSTDPVGQYVLMLEPSEPSLSLSFVSGSYSVAKSFVIAAHEPDGTGVSVLQLERA